MNRKVIGVKLCGLPKSMLLKGGRGEDEYDAFLEQLSSSLARPSTYDIVLGDFNASTGPRENGERFIARLSPETLQLMERRRQMKHAISGGARVLIEYAELSKLVRKCFKIDLEKHYEKVMGRAIEENRIKRGRSEMVQKQNQMIHLQRTDGVITETVAVLMEEIARFYNDLYSSEAGNPVHDRDPNVTLERITAEELVAASKRMKSWRRQYSI
uniref:Uncharacterized protein n=1 Tax=Panagrolaimus sp. PS1159 TaxID=55785 RepID=A0AC35GV72_9BILA